MSNEDLDPLLNTLFQGIIKGLEDYWSLAGEQRKRNIADELNKFPDLEVVYHG